MKNDDNTKELFFLSADIMEKQVEGLKILISQIEKELQPLYREIISEANILFFHVEELKNRIDEIEEGRKKIDMQEKFDYFSNMMELQITPFSIINIEKYFNLTGRKRGDNIEYQKGNNIIVIVEDNRRFVIITGIDDNDDDTPIDQYNFPYPLNLFDFYNDCHRCGIRLAIKEKSV